MLMTEEEIWYNPSRITFTTGQVIFIIDHLDTISPGSWPPNPRESGYVGGDRPQSFKHATFELPCCISAELKHRLECCGGDGKTCLNYYQQGRSDFLDAPAIAYRVVGYCSGSQRRLYSYQVFCSLLKQWEFIERYKRN